MFCPNCGANNPDNSYVCNSCGTPLSATPQQNYNQPAYNQPMYAQPPVTDVVSKKEYLSKMPSEKAKKASSISLVLAIVLVLTIVASYFVVVNTSVQNIPLISFSAKVSGDDADEVFDELLEELETETEMLEELVEENEDSLEKKEKKILDKFVDAAYDCSKSFSITNVKKFINIVEEAEDADLDEFSDEFGYLKDDLEETNDILSVVSTVLLIALLFVLLFAALGGFLKKIGLVIVSLIFSFIYALILCPVWLMIIIAAVHIALIVFLSQINSEYNNYKKSSYAQY